MKKVLSALALAALLPTAAFAQKVCGFTQVAAPHVGPGYLYVTGIMCMSEEAAIGAGHHWIDKEKDMTLGETIEYVNTVRGEETCFMANEVIAKKVSQTVKSDQDDNKYSVTVWQVKTENRTFTAITAAVIDNRC